MTNVEIQCVVVVSDFRVFRISIVFVFLNSSSGGSGDLSLSPVSSPCRDLSNELGPSSGN